MQKPLIKGIYRHYKGNLYQVIEVAKHCDSEEVLVVYRALYSDYGLWLRSLADFCAEVLSAIFAKKSLIPTDGEAKIPFAAPR